MSDQPDLELEARLRRQFATAGLTPEEEAELSRLGRSIGGRDFARRRGLGFAAVPALAVAAAAAVFAGVLGFNAYRLATTPRGVPTGASPAAVPSASPAVAPSPTPDLAVMAAETPLQTVPSPGQALVVRSIREDGAELSSFKVPADATWLQVRSGRAYFVLGGRLQSNLADGSAHEDLGPMALGGFSSLVVSPDGQRWLWNVTQQNGNQITSAVHLAGRGVADRVVTSASETQTILKPVAWTAGGPVLVHSLLGIGGYILFHPWAGTADRLDVSTGARRPLTTNQAGSAANCEFDDLSADGTVACIAYDGQVRPLLRLIGPSGSPRDLVLPGGDRVAGIARFSPDGRTVAVSSSPQVGADQPQEQYHSYLVHVDSLAVETLGGPGLQVGAWLPDGHLALFEDDRTTPGRAGLYVWRAAGAPARISDFWRLDGVFG
ncbi:MAG TPA: hypothetical protein VG245_09030 [Candidatus Dormibacteraeota bacterium]|jgi:hypothetical protein|nr:hypothetical protein [Candidatus Dormibacteraeota bacterium]